MNISTRPFLIVLCCGVLAAGLTGSARQDSAPLPPLVLPAGFQADVFAEKVENARSMALGPQGTVFVGSQYAGKVHAVVDSDGDHKADRVVVIASGLDQPNGVAMRNGALYVATASRLLRFDDIEKHLDAPPAPVTLRDDLPNPKAGHTWKFIAFGPDDMLYMSVGSTCNVCAPAAMTAAIVRMKPDGSGMEVFAEGVRNSVGFDWHPVTHELWFTDNGRDMSATTSQTTSSTLRPRPASTSVSLSAIRGTSQTRSSAHSARVRRPSLRSRSSARTWRRLVSLSTPATCFRPATRTRRSSPSMVRGIDRRLAAIGSWRRIRMDVA